VPDPVPFFDTVEGLASRIAGARVLFTDLDGTLLGRGAVLVADGEGQPALGAVQGIIELNRAGLPVVVTSGRNAKQLREITRLLGWADFIGELGCVRSYDHGARIEYETGDWPADALKEGETPYSVIAREGAVELLQKAFPGKLEYHAPWHLDRSATHLLRGDVPLAAAQAILDELPYPVSIVDNGVIHPPRHGLVGVTEVHAIHLVPAGASKQRSVRDYLLEQGISPDEALAIGDSAADVEMADVVGLMACVANGLHDPRLRDAAAGRRNVVATHASHGAGWAEFALAWLAARER
jgi:hypothetical protein